MPKLSNFVIRIECQLKAGMLDPEAGSILTALKSMELPSELAGVSASKVNLARIFTLEIRAISQEDANCAARVWARELLANPVIEDYRIVQEV